MCLAKFLQDCFFLLCLSPSNYDKHKLCNRLIIIKLVASFKLSLLLKNYLQRTQTLQLNEIGNYLQNQLEARKVCLDRESNADKCKHFNLEIIDWEPNWRVMHWML
jgi:hypothetical protein